MRISESTAKALDLRLLAFEHSLTSPKGLPGRPWYVHEVYAPGMYTGYGVKTLPAVREAIEQRQWSDVDGRIAMVAGVLGDAAKALDGARALLEPAAKP